MSAPHRYRRRCGIRPWIDLREESVLVFDAARSAASENKPRRGARCLIYDFTGEIVRVSRDGNRIKVRFDPFTSG